MPFRKFRLSRPDAHQVRTCSAVANGAHHPEGRGKDRDHTLSFPLDGPVRKAQSYLASRVLTCGPPTFQNYIPDAANNKGL